MDQGPVEPERPTTASGSLLGRDEMNFAEFPLALLTDRASSDLKTLEAEDRIYDERKGQFVHRKLTITASDKYGLPTPKDEDVLLGLIYRQHRHSDPERAEFWLKIILANHITKLLDGQGP
jgi:hypothetical protein